MKTSFKMVAMLLGIGIFPVCAHAQKKEIIEDEEPNSIMFVSRDKAGDEIIRIMNDRSQMRFHDPNAPRFLLTDQKGKFALGIGGYVRATAEYDFNGIVNDVDFYPALIPQRGSGNFAKNQFQMDITTSTLFLKLVGRTKHLGDFVVYTAGNFRVNKSPSSLKASPIGEAHPVSSNTGTSSHFETDPSLVIRIRQAGCVISAKLGHARIKSPLGAIAIPSGVGQ